MEIRSILSSLSLFKRRKKRLWQRIHNWKRQKKTPRRLLWRQEERSTKFRKKEKPFWLRRRWQKSS